MIEYFKAVHSECWQVHMAIRTQWSDGIITSEVGGKYCSEVELCIRELGEAGVVWTLLGDLAST